jgi:methylated-DNA-[protein]-cysteine S-methyltransferase
LWSIRSLADMLGLATLLLMPPRRFRSIDSPIGPLTLAMSQRGLAGVHMAPFEVPIGWVEDRRACLDAERQLRAYFAGELKQFELPVDLQGTPFQLQVWQALMSIPYGQTISYGQQAQRIGNSKASRAVGLANGRNVVAIVVPCHRVIGASGKLTGFGGGLDRKQFLLDLERRHVN